MASMEAMRTYVAGQYSGKWPEKVRKMPDHQILAIYRRMRESEEEKILGRFTESIRKELDGARQSRNPKITETEVSGGLQLSFFEGRHGYRLKEEYTK